MRSGNYALTNLGLFRQCTYDPHISAGIVIAAQDRPSPANRPQAAIWSEATGWTLIPDPIAGCQWSEGLGGHAGRIVGFMVPVGGSATALRAALWVLAAGGWTLTELPMPTTAQWATAKAINTAGDKIVGEAGDIEVQHAVLWTGTGSGNWTQEILPQTGTRAFAVGIDDVTGDVIGNLLDNETGMWNAVRWRLVNGLWTTAYLTPLGTASMANAYSDGVVVGQIGPGIGPFRAALWDATDRIHELGIEANSSAYGHRGGVVVGNYKFDVGAQTGKGFKWTEDAGMVDIHPPGTDWSFPAAIDTTGRIVGVMGNGVLPNTVGDKWIFLVIPSLPGPTSSIRTP